MSPNRSCAHNCSTTSPEPPSSSTRPTPAPSPMVWARGSTPRGRAHPWCNPPHSFPNWRKRVGGQLKTWASTIKDDLAALSCPQVVGLRRWNRDWLAISCNLVQEQRPWAAMVWDAVLAQEEAGSTRPGWKPIQVLVSKLFYVWSLVKSLANFNFTVIYMVSVYFLILSSSSLFCWPLRTVPSALITIGITVIFMFHIFFSVFWQDQLFVYLFAFFYFYSVVQ